MDSPGVDSLNGLVLIGGKSIRMGQDKSVLAYHNKPQREHLTDLLQACCNKVFWSVNGHQAAELADVEQPLIVDAFDNIVGPLNGILSAFQAMPDAAWLVVACDMPLLTAQSIHALVIGRDPAKHATAFYDSDGRFPEPLLSIWEPSIWPILQKAIAEGAYSPRRILMMNDVHLLTAPNIRELVNINDPAAKEALKHQQ
ncbi:NTP transferase domain-containing protein [Spirosoma aureum]|uniref:Probable molybdenum cofactor guanylyltransferase n=1 Tax=Spirosoma aureum TaxID=2692134 RepID=A0A6G9B034_9BACT|nr:NTP transferase domain-containing protein [Spirosoma aureum]